jgi:phage shock protein PspC (stress-responsive transcriptional regulator)
MKKTISINLNGLIFNVEEEGYEKLKAYLTSLNRYFSSYGDSKEILTDIEGRIAEKLSENLKKEDKSAVSLANIEELIASMGNVEDFEALEEEEDFAQKTEATGKQTNSSQIKNKQSSTQAQSNKILCRDGQRKQIGGVCAGLAHYFSIDVIWIRLIFLGLLGLVPLLESFSIGIFIIYIACWIAFPVKYNIPDDENIKKFFRDYDRKVLGGVTAGLAKYTGMDLGLLRLLFVISILPFGIGAMIYLILWGITPFAKTITQRMQMKGEAITIENIESNLKSNIDFSPQNESTFATILLLPFRIIGKIFNKLSPLFSVSGSIIRIFTGALLFFIAFLLLFSLFAALFSGIGLLGTLPIVVFDNIPINIIDAPKVMFLFIFLAVAVPIVILGLAGLSLLTRRSQYGSGTWPILGGLFLAGILGSTISVSRYLSNFQRYSYVKNEILLDKTKGTTTFDIAENSNFDNKIEVEFKIEASHDSNFYIIKKIGSRGQTEAIALKNAQSLLYNFNQKDSVIQLSDKLNLGEKAKYRNQECRITIKVPKNVPFIVTRRMAYQIHNFDLDWNVIHWGKNNLKINDETAARFVFNKEEVIEPLDRTDIEAFSDENTELEYHKEYAVQAFNKIILSGNLKVKLLYAEKNKIIASGQNSEQLEELKLTQNGQNIELSSGNDNILVEIYSNTIGAIELHDQTILIAKNYTSNVLNIVSTNESKFTITGQADSCNIQLGDNAEVEADEFEVKNLQISSSGESNAKVKALEKLIASGVDNSKIYYTGTAKQIQLSPQGNSEISKYNQED